MDRVGDAVADVVDAQLLVLAGRIDVKGKNVVIVLSGGNVDADLFAKLVA